MYGIGNIGRQDRAEGRFESRWQQRQRRRSQEQLQRPGFRNGRGRQASIQSAIYNQGRSPRNGN